MTTNKQVAQLIEDTFQKIHILNGTKGLEYATESDALANFKNRAAQLGLDPMQVWGIFFGKHADAIYAYIRNGKVLSEAIEGRIDDAILYLILLKGLIEERAANATRAYALKSDKISVYNPNEYRCACMATLIDPSAESKDLAGKRHRRPPQTCLVLRDAPGVEVFE